MRDFLCGLMHVRTCDKVTHARGNYKKTVPFRKEEDRYLQTEGDYSLSGVTLT